MSTVRSEHLIPKFEIKDLDLFFREKEGFACLDMLSVDNNGAVR